MIDRKVYIYFLEYLYTTNVYIGSTVNEKNRLHLHKIKLKSQYKAKHLEHSTLFKYKDGLKSEDLDIKMTILDVVNYEDRLFWENFYMELFRTWDIKLNNKQKIKNFNIIRYDRSFEKGIKRKKRT